MDDQPPLFAMLAKSWILPCSNPPWRQMMKDWTDLLHFITSDNCTRASWFACSEYSLSIKTSCTTVFFFSASRISMASSQSSISTYLRELSFRHILLASLWTAEGLDRRLLMVYKGATGADGRSCEICLMMPDLFSPQEDHARSTGYRTAHHMRRPTRSLLCLSCDRQLVWVLIDKITATKAFSLNATSTSCMFRIQTEGWT